MCMHVVIDVSSEAEHGDNSSANLTQTRVFERKVRHAGCVDGWQHACIWGLELTKKGLHDAQCQNLMKVGGACMYIK